MQTNGPLRIPNSSSELKSLLERAFQKNSDFISQESGDQTLNPQFGELLQRRDFIPAAVLIALCEPDENNNATILLTQRAEHLSSHSGQVAFPGGKIDSGESSIEAALREAEEEVGLKGSDLSILGQLGDYYSGSGYKIAPVIAHVNGTPELTINPDEVDSAFKVPAHVLFDPNSYQTESRFWEGRERFFYSMMYRDESIRPAVERRIWGVTAGIIRMVHDRIFANDP